MTAIPESVMSVLSVPVRQPAKDATGVLRDLHNAGIVPALSGDGLGIAIPAGVLSADLRQRVLACKPELIELLRHAATPPPAPPPQPVALPVPVTPAALAVPGCSNCEAATTKQWHGGYTMQCVGCMARLVLSARPSRQQQETMLACLDLRGGGRPERPTRQQVLERLQRR